METESMAAGNGRSLHPVALFCLRVAAGAVLVAGNAWVLFEYFQYEEARGMGPFLVIGGRGSTPMIVDLVDDYSIWLVVICSAAVLAAIVYAWGFARRAGSIIWATLGAASLCAIAGGLIQIATIEARKFNEEWIRAILDGRAARAASRP